MKCPVCGSTVEDNTTYCPECGSYLKIEIEDNESEVTEDLLNEETEESQEGKKKKRKRIDIRLIVLIIAILAIIGVILINNYLLSQNIVPFSGMALNTNRITLLLDFIYLIS